MKGPVKIKQVMTQKHSPPKQTNSTLSKYSPCASKPTIKKVERKEKKFAGKLPDEKFILRTYKVLI